VTVVLLENISAAIPLIRNRPSPGKGAPRSRRRGGRTQGSRRGPVGPVPRQSLFAAPAACPFSCRYCLPKCFQFHHVAKPGAELTTPSLSQAPRALGLGAASAQCPSSGRASPPANSLTHWEISSAPRSRAHAEPIRMPMYAPTPCPETNPRPADLGGCWWKPRRAIESAPVGRYRPAGPTAYFGWSALAGIAFAPGAAWPRRRAKTGAGPGHRPGTGKAIRMQRKKKDRPCDGNRLQRARAALGRLGAAIKQRLKASSGLPLAPILPRRRERALPVAAWWSVGNGQ